MDGEKWILLLEKLYLFIVFQENAGCNRLIGAVINSMEFTSDPSPILPCIYQFYDKRITPSALSRLQSPIGAHKGFTIFFRSLEVWIEVSIHGLDFLSTHQDHRDRISQDHCPT